MVLRVEDVSLMVGGDVFDEYGRVIGILVGFSSKVDGEIEYLEVKIAGRGLERIPGERASLKAGRLVVTPEWKYKAVKTIEALDRAYRRRNALTHLTAGEIPEPVIEQMRRKLEEEIKKLKVKAERSLEEIARRLDEIEDESLHVASAIAQIQMAYFSGEIADKNFQQGMTHLRRMKQSLASEKKDAMSVQDKLDKILKALESPKHEIAKKHAAPKEPAQEPAIHAPAKEEAMHVQLEE